MKGIGFTHEWLLENGFSDNGMGWSILRYCGPGPQFSLWISPEMGCDGCHIASDSYSVLVRMPQTTVEVAVLCSALGLPFGQPAHVSESDGGK